MTKKLRSILLTLFGLGSSCVETQTPYESWLVQEKYVPAEEIIRGLQCDKKYTLSARGPDNADYKLRFEPDKGFTLDAQFDSPVPPNNNNAHFDIEYMIGLDGIGITREGCYQENSSTNKSCSKGGMFSRGPFEVFQGTANPTDSDVALNLIEHKQVTAGLTRVYMAHKEHLCP
ncbi:hypothetical protein COV16_00495 [Candidatus Woesearchaeota archaeon CG10_big_fil_rev_8_21_14_0_10_34_8]|nr:MAG: hypothetical protein COV16_00495 [Candidatus Woesearchaeota archaeon CG10_big_fil_rev_8_21_14_0_10_34_8]